MSRAESRRGQTRQPAHRPDSRQTDAVCLVCTPLSCRDTAEGLREELTVDEQAPQVRRALGGAGAWGALFSSCALVRQVLRKSELCRVSCVVCRVPCAVCRVSVRLLLIRQVLGNTNSVGGGHCCVFLKSGPNLESPANGLRPWARCRGRPQN